MPILNSTFTPSVRSSHAQTLMAALLRVAPNDHCSRNRLELPDNDFIDYDLYQRGNNRLAILTHGLEGNSQAKYIRGMVRTLLDAEVDCLAWNMRGCSGEPNRLLRSYHSGLSSDLASVIDMILTRPEYQEIHLIGFSVGGNITLKYLGENAGSLPAKIRSAMSISAPIDLASSAEQLAKKENALYMRVFMRSLRAKLQIKNKLHPGKLDLSEIDKLRTFYDYDSRFLAPLFGFNSAQDYWEQSSALPLIGRITLPTLILSSADDTFLGDKSFPRALANTSSIISLLEPRHGGHVAFVSRSPWGEYFSQTTALDWITSRCGSTNS